MRQSYTSQPIGLRARSRELMRLWRFHTSSARTSVQALLGSAEEARNRLKQQFGFELRGRRLLEVGPGQFLIQSRLFALQSDVVAIDSDVIADKLEPGIVAEMIRHNGLLRAVKTVARKALGIDRTYACALREALGVDKLPEVKLERGDACRMQFPDEAFEMVYARSVLHHVRQPAAALSEMARVLKPGGVAYVGLHLYTGVNGSLDPRVADGAPPELYWAHLRDDRSVVEGASLNKLRLDEWRAVFGEKWPGSIVETIQSDNVVVHQEAERLMAEQTVRGYSKEELVTTTVTAMWQKPNDLA